jgi:hypothetical protein
MRFCMIIGFLAMPPLAFATSPECQKVGLGPQVLSNHEWDLVHDTSPSKDPVINEARFLLNKASDPISTAEMRVATAIPWAQAKRLLLLGAVSRIYTAYPNEGLYLGTRSGKVYSTKVAPPDNLWDLTKLVDPCHAYISVIEP